MHLDLRVDLKTGDLVRQTAIMTIEETLGWKGIILGIGRCDLWRFEGEGERFREEIEREVARTSVFVNTTKHNARFEDEGDRDFGQELTATEALEPARVSGVRRWRARLWITEEGGERESLRRRVQARLETSRLKSLKGGVLWEIELRAAAADQARGAVTGLAISRSRESGLLLNPHFQEGRLLSLEEVSA